MMDGKLRSLGSNLNVNVSQYGNENTNFIFPEMLRFVNILWLKRRVFFPFYGFFPAGFFLASFLTVFFVNCRSALSLRSSSSTQMGKLARRLLSSVLVYLPYI